ncbi:MAG: HAD family hydrolase [Pseudomonadales bacterium]|nr:HAD family hydrolase [Pseudomonadales bacterium]
MLSEAANSLSAENKVVPGPDIIEKARQVRLLILDVDGVLTDGKLYYSAHGDEFRAFSTLDGQGIKLLQDTGVKVGIISGRESKLVKRRAENLGIAILFQGCENKLAVLDEILQSHGLTYAQSAYMGDDLPDLACIRRVGLGVAVANAHTLIRQHAHYATALPGGNGAVREMCDLILQAQNTYEDAIKRFL